MNEQRFGKEIRDYLNQGLDLPQAQIDRLKAAREQALAQQRVARFAFAPAFVTRAFGPVGVLGGGNAAGRWVLPVLLVAAAVVGVQQWQSRPDVNHAEAEAFAEIDAEILKSDLPLGTLIDAGFRHFVKGDGE